RVEQVGSFNTAHDRGLISPEQTKLTAQIQNGALRLSVLTEAVDPNALSREWALVGEQFEEVSTRDSRLDNTVFLAAEMTAVETADTKTLLQALNSSSPRVTAALNAQRGSTRLAEQEVELAPHDDATDSEQSKVTSAKTESQATAAHGAANQRNPLAATQSLMAQIAGGQTEGETGAHDPSANGAGEFLRTLNSATLHERTERAAAPNQIAQLEIPKGIAQLASGQVKTLTLKISPASLGEAKLSVSLVRDRIHGSLIVESHAAKSAIEGQLHKLVDRLAHEGLTLDSLDVEVGADQWSEDRASQWRQRAETPRTRFSLEDIEQEISGGAVAPEQGRLGARNVISAAGVDALV
ncbi:MAG TPA: flagellar hook-length control protein FliK, partial [candidate division Zixibacteria bacterium]|nr:flagellar hook-length control protein FliK [candidate division Zixibacteria bacterium]